MTMLRHRKHAIAFLASALLHLGAASLFVWPRPHWTPSALPPAVVAESPSDESPRGPMWAGTTDAAGDILALTSRVAGPTLSGLTNHLWQSTWFAAVIGLLALVFMHARARVRHALWLGASLKFFVPFSLLVFAGRALAGPDAPPKLASSVAGVVAPLGALLQVDSVVMSAAVGTPATNVWIVFAVGVWAVGFFAIGVTRLRGWRRIHRVLRQSRRLEADPSWPPGVVVRTAPGLLEPGVVGWLHPVILLPTDIERQLTPAQLRTVIAHEACHIRRRDNLTSSLHMFVEAVHWFHPAVWWIGGRLVRERERACDQAVLRAGGDARTYAESIIVICRRYFDSQLACVSGVSASSVKARVEAIMRNDVGRPVSVWKQWLLGTCGAVAVVVPITLGIASAPRMLRAQPQDPRTEAAFSTVSIRPHAAGDRRRTVDEDGADRFEAVNATTGTLIRVAYDLPAFRVAGGPPWLEDDGFDIVATAARGTTVTEKRLMLRRLLAERFGLAVHHERRDQSVYVLALADRNGLVGRRMRPAAAGCASNGPATAGPIGVAPAGGSPCGFLGFSAATDFASRAGGLTFRALTIDGLATKLSPILGRQVVDRTGLRGQFDADFDFIAEIPMPPPPPGDPRQPVRRPPSAWTIFPEQLGLKFDGGQAPVDVLVIDRVDRPKEQ